MNSVLVLRRPESVHRAGPHRAAWRRDFSAALWTAGCISVALAFLFLFFFRMEESVAQQIEAHPDAEWAQRHWQCSAVPVMKQAVCEEHLARMQRIETAHASAVAR